MAALRLDTYGASVGAESVPHWVCLEYRHPQSPASIVTYFLPYEHTYTNKATPPQSAAPYGPSIHTHEFIRPYLCKPPHYSNHFHGEEETERVYKLEGLEGT